MFDVSVDALAAVAAYDNPFRQFIDDTVAEIAKENRLRAQLLKRLFPQAVLPAVVTWNGFDDVMATIPPPR